MKYVICILITILIQDYIFTIIFSSVFWQRYIFLQNKNHIKSTSLSRKHPIATLFPMQNSTNKNNNVATLYNKMYLNLIKQLTEWLKIHIFAQLIEIT